MDKKRVLEVISELKKGKQRKFPQSYDLIINLKNVNIKQNPIDFFATLPKQKGKETKVAAFVGPELAEQANKNCDLSITESDFEKYKDPKVMKKLAQSYDYFIAQATLMPKVAATFGKVLGTRSKMPNPKLGCVVPPNANIAPLIEKLTKTVRMSAKKATNLQCMVGKESMSDNDIADNIISAYNSAVKQLPNELQNVKRVQLKLTMGKPVTL
ncbi:MAG: 50S ribosomal protein L1 [archaeon]|nr:50S ribosomal protein L1 [Nanoarchaeota archaeon]